MLYRFPYFEDRPHIPITLIGPEKSIRYLPLLDSGADFTTLSRNDALFLGLKWDLGESVEFSNADGSTFDARLFKLPLIIEGLEMRVRVCFLDRRHSTMPLLGRSDVFRHFEIMIDEASQMVELRKR